MSALFVVQGRNKKYGSINRDFWQRCYKLTGLAGWSIMQIDILGGMGMETKEKAVQAQTGAAKGKKSRKKVWAVVIGVLLAVIVVAIAFIELSTLPRKDTADADLNPAGSSPRLQFRKSRIFPFDSALVCIDI